MTPGSELLRALGIFLRERVQPGLDGYTAFENRVAVNLLAILEREAALGAVLDAMDRDVARGLGEACAASPSVLARALRDGAVEADAALLKRLRLRSLLSLEINSPRYSARDQARVRWPELAAVVDDHRSQAGL